MKRTVVILGVLLSLGLFWACSKSDETTPVQSPEGGTGETVTNVSSVENQTGGPSSSASSDENGEEKTKRLPGVSVSLFMMQKSSTSV